MQPRATAAASDFDEIPRLVAADFPKATKQRMGQLTITLTPAGPQAPAVDVAPLGLVLQTTDDRMLAQFRTDGFTLNRLRPYSSWEELRPAALRLWQLYVRTARPARLVRLALRYINELRLPSGDWEFSEYFSAAPGTPEGAPQQVAAFSSKVTAVEPEKHNAVHIGQTLRHVGPDPVYMLDIDAFRDGDWEPSDPGAADVLDDLRRLKNVVFFNMLTERALRLCE